ncbi:MAG TPA: hypothetical protein VJJ82_00840 [Candidatus Nanoarchaeia archaeon]|nr:hypothetical protein [Candidatus Nanoarchaeia archaeon]
MTHIPALRIVFEELGRKFQDSLQIDATKAVRGRVADFAQLVDPKLASGLEPMLEDKDMLLPSRYSFCGLFLPISVVDYRGHVQLESGLIVPQDLAEQSELVYGQVKTEKYLAVTPFEMFHDVAERRWR